MCRDVVEIDSLEFVDYVVRRLRDRLPQRSVDVLLGRACGQTLAELAKRYSLSCERIRQIHARAILSARYLLIDVREEAIEVIRDMHALRDRERQRRMT